MKKIYLAILAFLRERFSLSQDQDNESEIVEAIRKGVVFKGINLWMLIFAIFIASIGLNVNSTAVIIGAMLISPLMGPIMGLGLGAGINDLPLINVAIKNLAIAVIFSIITSALYFSISPLSQAQSELLARTSPTFWDVLIAFFGGLAGVFAGSSKEKGNAIPGVAIATALMPPLCTAGYGLATGNLSFFFGALYLFFINSVMISASTFMVVQFLNFRHAEYMDQGRAKNVKRIIYALVFFTVVPSIYFGYTIVRKSGFEIEANNYIRKEFSNESYYVLNKQIEYKNSKDNKITLYVGGYMDSLQIEKKKANLENYRLENCVLEIKQGTQLKEILKNEQNQMDQISLAHAKELADKDSIIGNLKLELESNSKKFYNPEAIGEELRIFFPSISEFGISEGTIYSEKDSSSSASTLVFLASEGKIKESQYEEIERWLEKRLDTKNIKIVKRVKLSTFFLLLLLLSCKPSSNKLELPTSKEEELLPTYNSGTKIYESSLLDSVVKEYLLYLDIDTSHLHSISNNTIETNYIALKEESFEARLYTDSEGSFIAINHAEDKDNCTWHKAFLLRKNEKNIWEDQFDSFYPNLSLYSFYTFEDEETKQFEGDEETVFAGYHFDLSSSESLGIQFMFCNLRDQGNTQSLNLNAHRIYKDIHE